MRVKYFSLLMCILMTISLISFGFSSWVITNPPEVVTGTIGTDEVFNSKDYFELVRVNNLEYCTDGYVNNNVISNIGQMTLHYRINNINYFNETFKGVYNSLNVKLKMKFMSNNYNIFRTIKNVQSSSHEILSEYLDVSDTFPTGKINNEYNLNFTINYLDLLEEDSYDLTITFKFEYYNLNFTTIYNELKSLGMNAFTIDTIVVGCANQGMFGGGNIE